MLKRLLASAAPICLFAATAAAQAVSHHDFATPSVTLGADGYARIFVSGTDLHQPVGRPGVPFVADRIELPCDATDVTVEALPKAACTNLLPALPAFGYAPAAVSSATAERRGAPDPAIYAHDAFYPSSHAELVSLQRENGRLFAVVRVYPVRVNPPILAYESVSAVEVRVAYSLPAPRRTTTKSTFQTADNDWTYLLVTTDSLASAFTPLVDYKIATGTPVHVLDIADVLVRYTGADAAEKTRNAIRDGYANHGTRYVLLGGGGGVIPVRLAYASISDKPSVTNLVSDLYYACLDGSWDGNGNGVYGEPEDGEDGGDVDLAADVYVGRIPATTAEDVANFVSKTLLYATNAHVNTASALLAGEYLGRYTDTSDGQSVTYHAQGGAALDPLDEALRTYSWTWLDDRPAHGLAWGAAAAEAALNAAPNLVAHCGHGQINSCMHLSPAYFHSLSNSAPFLLNSMACHSGNFTTPQESIAEAGINSRNAAFAAVLNTHYGWFDTACEWMYSAEFLRAFFMQAVLHGHPIGEALQRSKSDMLAKVETTGKDLVYRWCYFENMLFGDPQLALQRPGALKVVNDGNNACILLRGSPLPEIPPFKFSLYNTYDAETPWIAIATSPLFIPDPVSGTFTATDTNAVSILLAADVATLPAGTYGGSICFSNLLTSAKAVAAVSLAIAEPPVVTDSVGPADDASLPFGTVTTGGVRTETVTIHNADTATPITIGHVSLDGVALQAGLPRPDTFLLYDQYNGYLRLLSPTNGYLATPLSHYYYFTGGLEVLPDAPATAWALDYERNLLARFDLDSGSYSNSPLPAPDGGIWSGLSYSPYHRQLFAALAFDNPANAYYNTTRIYVLDPNDVSLVRLGTTEGILCGIAFDRTGTLFALDVQNDRLLALDPYSGDAATRAEFGCNLHYSQGLASDSAGLILYAALYDADTSNCRLATLDAAAGTVTDIMALGDDGGQFELAVLPSDMPFAVTTSDLPLTIAPGASATVTLACAPVATGFFRNALGLHLVGLDEPFASVSLSCESMRTSDIAAPWLECHGLATDGTDDHVDTDGDGLTNYEEWLCGTSPIDAADVLAVTAAAGGADGFTLDWPAVPGLIYAVKSSTSPAGPYETIASLAATNAVMSYTDSRGLSNAFYRVSIPASPRR